VDEPEPATVRAAMAGDIAAFEQLVRAYQDPVWRFLCRLVGDQALAEDVTQEAFVRLYRKLPTFAFQSKFSTWLLQIARNAGIDALRARARRDGLVETLAQPSRHRTSTADLGLGLEIESAIATLGTKHREAILLIDALGFTYREAGEVLGVPAGTVKSRVFQAREQVHAWFDAGEVPAAPHRTSGREVGDEV